MRGTWRTTAALMAAGMLILAVFFVGLYYGIQRSGWPPSHRGPGVIWTGTTVPG